MTLTSFHSFRVLAVFAQLSDLLTGLRVRRGKICHWMTLLTTEQSHRVERLLCGNFSIFSIQDAKQPRQQSEIALD